MSLTEERNRQQVMNAFGRQSPLFDEIDQANEIIGWVREQVRREMEPYLQPGKRILELNCGTGIDSLYFASKGMDVLATDHSPEMLAQLTRKVEGIRTEGRGSLNTQCLSFLDLHQLPRAEFSIIFSNFGGLNCTSRMDLVFEGLNHCLAPGGIAALVIMPPLCPWEWLMAFRGYFQTAVRRLRRKGTPARVEGVPFLCYYYSPDDLLKLAGENWEVQMIRSLCLLVPPPFMEGFRSRYPHWFSRLERAEEKICRRPPFCHWGDHYMMIIRKKVHYGPMEKV